MIKRIIRLLLKYIPRTALIPLSLKINKIIALFLKGNNVECPICEGRFRKFLPYGYTSATGRNNALCPRCLSLERHRLLWLYMKEKTDFFTKNLRVIHVAPEQCFYKRFKALSNLDYTTADIESPIADVHFDIQEIPFENNEFDVVICNHVLEHVEDDSKAMREIYRVLKKDGFAIMQVPQDTKREKTYEDPNITNPAEREKHFFQKDHLRLYGKDYPKRLKTAGFKVIEERFVNDLDVELVGRYCLPKDEIIYLIKK